MNTPIPFYVALFLLFPLCHAQCALNVPDQQLVNALNEVDLISETDPTKFTLQDLTYICFIRSSTDNTRFDQVRISMLYTYYSATVRSAQATFSLCLSGSFRFTSENTYTVTQDPHLTENMTREDCQDCLDNSTFARPTFCRREYKNGKGRGIEVSRYSSTDMLFSFLQWTTPVMLPHVPMVGPAVVLV